MHSGSVLIVDEDAQVASRLCQALGAYGWRVVTASDTASALEHLATCAFDAIILDEPREPARHSILEQLTALSRDRRPRAVVLAGYATASASLAPSDADAAAKTQSTALASSPTVRPDAAERFIGEARAIRAVREQIRTVARFPDLSVVIIGETGTGKELVAEASHQLSGNGGAFIPVNCAAIPEPLFESELFGYEVGAFSGAKGRRAGLLEAAGAGTIFLDEVGEMPPVLQPKLLRALETRTFRRLGSNHDQPFLARIVSATNRRLNGSDGIVRSDLFYRLAGFSISTPAIRERTCDIDLLAARFLEEFAERYANVPRELTPRALEALHAYDWPGNVRELKAVVQQAAVLARGSAIGVTEIACVLRGRRIENESLRVQSTPPRPSPEARRGRPALSRGIQRQAIEDAWQAAEHNLSRAARSLGLPRTTLRDRLRRYGLR